MAQSGRTKIDWLQHFLPCENRIPNEETISWLIDRLNIKAVERCFAQWAARLISESDGKVVAIDDNCRERIVFQGT